MKPGRVVIILQGEHAGHKAVILKVSKPTQKHKFYHCIVAGISKYPKRITPRMDRGSIKRRSQIETFIKVCNYKHILPTRYRMHLSKSWKLHNVTVQSLSRRRSERKKKLNTRVRQKWQRIYFTHAVPQVRWFFKKLYF